jgi:uncharacterized membrane protein YkgB
LNKKEKNMKTFAYILMVVSLLIGVLVDMNYFEEVQLTVFSSFLIFLTAIYILSVKKI